MTRKVNTSDSADSTTYSWDADNRLVGIAQPGLSASFTYDALGRRIQSSIARTGQTVKTVQYLYEGAQALGEIRDGSLSHRLLTGLELDESLARIAMKPSGEKDTANSWSSTTDSPGSLHSQQFQVKALSVTVPQLAFALAALVPALVALVFTCVYARRYLALRHHRRHAVKVYLEYDDGTITELPPSLESPEEKSLARKMLLSGVAFALYCSTMVAIAWRR